MNFSRSILVSLVAITCFVLLTLAQQRQEPAQTQAGEYKLSGPYTSGNLTVFLVHGQEQLPGKKYLTLAEIGA